MSAFQAVNTTTLTVPESAATRPGETTPTTPTPGKFFATQRQAAAAAAAAAAVAGSDHRIDDPAAKTPTRDSFGGLAGQKPLPSSPFGSAHSADASSNKNGVLSKANSRRSTKSDGSQDVKMADDNEDSRDGGSDNESATSESNSRPSKKKKGQRFFCTDFPPCTLSFTRSEHLARHIRKHTGERPFQCHCSRRFSRLDNLRQHAQTVHVNEDIPGDSLAATGTRFQRQIRTDRVRPPNRSRASTLGSQGGHSRGHSRNLSTSSIASTASSVSQISTRDDPRRRPPPLAMANDGAARARLSLDTFNPSLMGGPGPTVPNPSYAGNQSPSGLSTPTSATYSGTGSPRFPSGLQSPVSNPPRPAWGSRTPGRRLSVPSGTNPFQAPPNSQAPYISPLPSATSSTFSGNSSMYASPTASGFVEPRRDSNALDADWRRRTWHPGTYTGIGPRPATSGLSYYQTPDAPRPLFSNQPAASQTTRLPGIESFDHAPPPPALPRRQPSPMQIDNPSRPPPLAGPFEPSVSRPEERRGHMSWDLSVQRGISRLDITGATPPRDSAHGWSESTSSAVQPHPSSTGRPTTAPGPSFYSHAQHAPANSVSRNASQEQDQKPTERPVTPPRNKRHAWYHGPLSLGQQQQQPPQPSAPGHSHSLSHSHSHSHSHSISHSHSHSHSYSHSYSHSHQSSQSSFRTQRTSPEDSSSSDGVPTPSSSLGEYHPAIVHSNGYIESHPPGAPVDDHQKPGITQLAQPFAADRNSFGGPARPYSSAAQPPLPSAFAYRAEAERVTLPGPGPAGLGIMASRPEPASNDMRRLEALVAVATGEQQGPNRRQ